MTDGSLDDVKFSMQLQQNIKNYLQEERLKNSEDVAFTLSDSATGRALMINEYPLYTRMAVECVEDSEILSNWILGHLAYNQKRNEFVLKDLPSKKFKGFIMKGREDLRVGAIESHIERKEEKGYRLMPDFDYATHNMDRKGLYPEDSPCDAAILSLKQDLGVSSQVAGILFGILLGLEGFYLTATSFENSSNRNIVRVFGTQGWDRHNVDPKDDHWYALGYNPLS